MTLTTTDTSSSHVGNNVTVLFNVGFQFFNSDEIAVYKRVISTGVETLQVEGTDYTVTGGDGLDGQIDFTVDAAPPADTEEIHIRRVTDKTQENDFTPSQVFPNASVERALDRSVARDQEDAADISRAMTIPITDGALDMALPSSVSRASKVLAFDSSGLPVMSVMDDQSLLTVIATDSTTARSHQERWSERRNVLDYGAVGDGSTDDSDEIQACFDAAAAGGGVVVFPFQKTFVCKDLDIDASGAAPFVIEGNHSTLKAKSDLAVGERILSNLTEGSYADTDIVIRDLIFDGDNIGTTPVRTSALIVFQKVIGLRVEGCRVTNTQYIGLSLNGTKEATLLSCKFDDCGWKTTSMAGGDAVWISEFGGGGANGAADIAVIDCEFFDNNWGGLLFGVTRGIVSGCRFKNNQEAHIFSDDLTDSPLADVTVVGNTFEGVTANGGGSAVAIEFAGRRIRISDNVIKECEQFGVALTRCQSAIVSGNTIGNCGVVGTEGYCVLVQAMGTAGGGDDSKNILVSGNVFYDDNGTSVTEGGFRVTGSGDTCQYVKVEGNVFEDGLIGTSGVISMAGKWLPEDNCEIGLNTGADAPITFVSAATLNLQNKAVNTQHQTLLVTSSNTVSNILQGLEYQRLTIFWPFGSTAKIEHAAGGAGEIHLADDQDLLTHAQYDSLDLIMIGTDWYETGRSSALNGFRTIASAASIAVTAADEVLEITDNTAVTNITAGAVGQRLTIIWAAAATFDVTDAAGGAGQIHLAGGAHLTTWVATDTLALVCDGTDWYEVSRSDNT
jgi:hypothetical protein